MKIPLRMKLFVFIKLTLPCRLWKLRGLQTCPHHGFHAQSWLTGYCRKCGEIPVMPPMEDTCTFCGKEKAVLQRADPNGTKDILSLCWECNEFITWSLEDLWCRQAEEMGLKGRKVKPFDEWLFDKHQVWPKHSYSTIHLKKINEDSKL